MAKMTRGDLKSLVKECLLEILVEATDSTGSLMENRASRSKSSKTKTTRRSALDHMAVGPKKEEKPLDVSSITSDPVMAAIFQDTARTTLVEQTKAERLGAQAGGDAASMAAARSNPEELFGDASKNWAALAFDE